MESVGLAEEEELLQCFRCDLGLWDACYTTETNCSLGERCYTGRGKAGVLDRTVFLVSVCLLISIISTSKLILTECHHFASSADVLDVKTLGCVKAEECDVETTVELFPNNTVFVMTKHCCDTPFCNSAHKLRVYTPLYLAAAFLTTWLITEASTRPQ